MKILILCSILFCHFIIFLYTHVYCYFFNGAASQLYFFSFCGLFLVDLLFGLSLYCNTFLSWDG